MSRTTLWRRLSQQGITLSSYSDINDGELDGVMELLVKQFPYNLEWHSDDVGLEWHSDDVGPIEKYEYICYSSKSAGFPHESFS